MEKDVGVVTIKPFFGGSVFNDTYGKVKFPVMGVGSKKENDLARLTIQCILANPAITASVPGLSTVYEVENAARASYTCQFGMAPADKEWLMEVTDHLPPDITCDVCHGASTEHVHDEMLMTKPDLLFSRSEVRRMCSRCHTIGEEGQLFSIEDHSNPNAVKSFLRRWAGRMRPNGRNVSEDSVCTDCHGTHNISKPLKVASEGERIRIWLNSEEIGVVRAAGSTKGKIGLYIAKHPDSASYGLNVREMLIQPLASENPGASEN